MSTETLTRPDTFTIDMAEFEEAKPCEGKVDGKPCTYEAKWAVWTSHDPHGCPMTFNMCDMHKDHSISRWEHYLKCPSHHCNRCGIVPALVGGPLENWVRIMEL